MGDMTEEIREEIEGSESADSVNETGGSSIADSLSGGSVLGSAPSGGGSIAESLGV